MNCIYCLANHNKGSGKTATAINLAASIAVTGKTTLLVSFLGEEDGSSHPRPESDSQPDIPYQHPHITTFWSLSFSFPGSTKDPVAYLHMRIRTAISQMGAEDPFILIDAPSSLAVSMRAVFAVSDGFYIPMEIKGDAFDRLAPTFAAVDWVRNDTGSAIPFLGIIPVRVQKGQRLHQIFSGPVFPFFASRVIPIPVPEDACIQNALEKGEPGMVLDLLSPAVVAFQRLAAIFLENGNGKDRMQDLKRQGNL